MNREWRIDSLGEDTAAVEQNGELVHVPRWLLPPTARETDVIRIMISDHGPRRQVIFRIDEEATQAALEASRRQVASTPPQNDPGGPISL